MYLFFIIIIIIIITVVVIIVVADILDYLVLYLFYFDDPIFNKVPNGKPYKKINEIKIKRKETL